MMLYCIAGNFLGAHISRMIQFANFEISKIHFVFESGCGLFASACSLSGLRARMSLLRYLKKGLRLSAS